MINIIKSGRLGNNMFQFAFGYAVVKKPNFNLIYDSTQLALYFKLKGYNNYIFRNIRKIKYLFSLKFNQWEAIDLSQDLPPQKIIQQAKQNTIIYGYFQSEQFFVNIRSEIKKSFQLRSPFIKEFKEKQIATGFQKYNVVHVRLGDYITENLALPISYFHKAIEELDSSKKDNYVFISDEPGFIEKEFSYLANIYVSNSSEIIDFQFLMNANNCVLSNSSFSWWGAYLNQKVEKTIAPKYWFGFREHNTEPPFIMNDNFILIDPSKVE